VTPLPPAGEPDGGSAAPGDGEGTVRWRLDIAYDGSGFHGFAAQRGIRTVSGELAEAVSRVARVPVTITCAGRTDTGVHAQGQVVHIDLPAEAAARLEPATLVRSCNRQLGPAVVVRRAGPAAAGFDARHSATARRYRYLVVNAPTPDPLLAGVAWHVIEPLDLRTMAAAADALLGEHDFRAFCRRVPGTTAEDPIPRRVTDTRWYATTVDDLGDRAGRAGRAGRAALVPSEGRLLAFEIEANAFCHQMVRSIVGTLVDVGMGRKRASDILWILRSADRGQASQPAPPHGLCLMAVRYGD